MDLTNFDMKPPPPKKTKEEVKQATEELKTLLTENEHHVRVHPQQESPIVQLPAPEQGEWATAVILKTGQHFSYGSHYRPSIKLECGVVMVSASEFDIILSSDSIASLMVYSGQ